MINASKVVQLPVVEKKEYKPLLSKIERRSYAAAHRILEANQMPINYGTPGRRRIQQVDVIASIIMQHFGGKKVSGQ